MNILVVDDEPAYRELLKTTLRLEGWDVSSAADGVEGLQRLSDTMVDIIVSDIYMPTMDGLKFHAQVRSMPEFAATPFLFISGHADQATLAALTKSKNDGFFQKTQSLKLLKDWVRYLTTPIATRPSRPPEENTLSSEYARTRDMPPRKRR